MTEPVVACDEMAPMSLERPVRHRIAVIALDEVIAFDLGVPSQIFHSARDSRASAAVRRTGGDR